MKNKIQMAAQELSSEDKVLVGNKKGLLALREAIDQAIINGESEVELTSSNNENFTFNILMNEDIYSGENELAKVSIIGEGNRNKISGYKNLGYHTDDVKDKIIREKKLKSAKEIMDNFFNDLSEEEKLSQDFFASLKIEESKK
jgi:hypothetical protein